MMPTQSGICPLTYNRKTAIEEKHTNMNVLTLIDRHPLLRADLHAYGLPNTQVDHVAAAISEQLGGVDGNLCHVMATLSTKEFVHAVDTRAVADGANLSPSLVQSIILTLAPWIGQFKVTSN
jgi:hypothetical protein